MSSDLTFENFCQALNIGNSDNLTENFLNVSTVLIVLSTLSSELTFENSSQKLVVGDSDHLTLLHIFRSHMLVCVREREREAAT